MSVPSSFHNAGTDIRKHEGFRTLLFVFDNGKTSCCLSPGGPNSYEAVDESEVNRHVQNKTALKYARNYANRCEVLWRGRLSVCLSVCLFVRNNISRSTRAIFTNFSMHVAYGRGSVLLRRVTKFQGGTGSSGGFLPHWQCLVQHRPIIWDPYKNGWTDRDAVWMMTWLGHRYHVLDGWLDPPRARGNFWENVKSKIREKGSARKRVMGVHSAGEVWSTIALF